MQQAWQLDAHALHALFPSASKLRDPACGADVCVQRLVAELLTDPRTALQAVMDAYLKLATHAKQRQQAGDPWPVLIIHDARSLLEYWKDDEALLSSLLCFFVAISKQAQLAHVILESGDTVLLQELETGAPARACAGVPLSVYSNCLSARAGRLHQAPVPLLVRGGKPGARGGAHVLLRLHRALSDAPAWRNGGMGARVRSVRRQSVAAADVRRRGRCILQLGAGCVAQGASVRCVVCPAPLLTATTCAQAATPSCKARWRTSPMACVRRRSGWVQPGARWTCARCCAPS